MAMVNVGVVRMGMFQGCVNMRMRMRFLGVPCKVVGMLVVAVMAVFMHMVEQFMIVFMRVGFCQV